MKHAETRAMPNTHEYILDLSTLVVPLWQPTKIAGAGRRRAYCYRWQVLFANSNVDAKPWKMSI